MIYCVLHVTLGRYLYPHSWASQAPLAVKNQPAIAGDVRDIGSIPGLRRCPAGGYGNPCQDSCLENPKKREAWQATVHKVAKSQTRLQQLNTHMSK